MSDGQTYFYGPGDHETNNWIHVDFVYEPGTVKTINYKGKPYVKWEIEDSVGRDNRADSFVTRRINLIE